MQAGGTLWSLGLALLCVLLTHDILSTRKHSWMPSAVATLAAATVSANFGWLLLLHQSEEHGSKDHSFLGMVLLLSLLSLGSSFALMVRQMQEAVVDKADLKKLEQVMAKLDADDDGHVDKVEFKSIYQEVFPGFGGTFEELWARLANPNPTPNPNPNPSPNSNPNPNPNQARPQQGRQAFQGGARARARPPPPHHGRLRRGRQP